MSRISVDGKPKMKEGKVVDTKEKHRREDAEKIYARELFPTVDRLMNICKQLKLPVVLSICMDPGSVEENNKAIYKHEILTPRALDIHIEPTTNYIAEYFKIINGFHAVPNELERIDADELSDFMNDLKDLQ